MQGTLKVINEKGWSNGNTTRTIALPVITGIEDTDTASLTEINTVIYGAENRFVMDLGTQRRITLSCTRVNPPDYNDSSSDPEKWSNGKWYNHLVDTIDVWQNQMGVTTGGSRAGGMILTLKTLDAELFPNIENLNVFLLGSLNPKFSVQKMTFSLPFVVASMMGSKADLSTVSLILNPGVAGVKSLTRTMPKDAELAVPSIPASWQNLVEEAIFSHWVSSGSAKYRPGEVIKWTSDLSLTAVWQRPLGVKVFTTAGVTKGYVPPTGSKRVIAYIIGAGGGGGGCGSVVIQSGSTIIMALHGGGAGAGGEMIIHSFAAPESIDIHVGEGGSGGESTAGNKGTNGSKGEDTYIIYGSHILNAEGGDGGTGQRNTLVPSPAAGGAQYYKGGDSGEAGSTDDSGGTPGIPGKAGPSGTIGDSSGTYSGGAGGGAPPLNHSIGGSRYIAMGGNGVGEGAPEAGLYGGGGGTAANSTEKASGGKGGDGFVALVFYPW